MRLDVPFFQQTTDLNCGPAALRMVLAYFGENCDLALLEEKSRIKKDKGVFTIQIAIAAASLGHKTDFFSKQVSFNKDNLELDFYQKYADLIERSDSFLEEARKMNVNVQERKFELDELLSNINQDCLPIILLDWNIIKGEKEKGYHGHFVPIVGYDKENVYVHNHGLKNPVRFLPIKKEIFDEARKEKGTDEDIVFVHRN
jgi:hypothetical protein